MKHYIIQLYNTRQKLKRELKFKSTIKIMKAFKHIDAQLRDELC